MTSLEQRIPLRHEPPGTIMVVTEGKHDQQESARVAWVICEKVRKAGTAC